MNGRRTAAAALTLLLAALAPAGAGAVSLEQRTVRLSVDAGGAGGDAPSTRPAVSGDGRIVAFDSPATNLDSDRNGGVRDVFLHDTGAATTSLVTLSPAGLGASGPSSAPVLDGAGRRMAFVSAADNLVPGDGNGLRDVFVREASGAISRVSVADGGGDAAGESLEPDLSRDGRLIAFTSTAPNLVPGDANGAADVFVRDLMTGAVRRVTALPGREPDGAARAPSISPDGRFVTYESAATNIVPGDTNGVPDVFVIDLLTGATERVSVSSREGQQNRAVIPPFAQISDVSRGGRYVVFDSDADNLVPGDTNSDTDVFVRDRVRGTTTRLSLSTTGRQADNDSFFPSMAASGRYVAFESFAANLVPRDPRREDVFLHDRRTNTTTLVSVTTTGRPRDSEVVEQLLQRPAVSDDGRLVAFTSTAALVAGDGNRAEDVYLRDLSAPRARVSVRQGRYRLRADDPAADRFLCRLDSRRLPCGRSGRLPALRPGRHVLSVQAGGPGMLFQERPTVARFETR